MSDKQKKPEYRLDPDELCDLPEPIKAHPYFCLWKWTWDTKNATWKKVPHNPVTGRRGKSNYPSTFAPLDVTLEAFVRGGFDGVGVGLFDGLSGIDIDHHLDANGDLDGFAQGIVREMCGYTEVSPSGDGLHVLFWCQTFTAEVDRDSYMKTWLFKNSKDGLETYVSGLTNRFLTVTGKAISTGGYDDRSEALRRVLDQHMRRKPKPSVTTASRATGDGVDEDDQTLVSRAMRSKNGDKFTRLWKGDISDYGSASEADQALCNMLAFWTGRDAERMDRLFRASGLFREKWEREDYRSATINKAIEDTTVTYDPNHNRADWGEALELGQTISGNGTRDERNDGDGDPSLKSGSTRAHRLTIKPSTITDLGLAKLFAESVRDVQYVAELKSFVSYDGRKWEVCGGDRLAERRVKDFIVSLKRLVGTRLAELADVDMTQDTPEARETKDMQVTYSLLCDYSAQNRRMHLVKDIQSERGVYCTFESFDSRPNMLNCENGTLDLSGSTPVFRTHDPADRITRLAPVKYDPDAKCPLFVETINDVLEGDVELIDFVQKWFGVIVGGVTAEEKFLLLGTANRTGKNTVLHPLFVLLGGQSKNDRSSYAVAVEPATLAEASFTNGHGPSSDLARLQGKRLMLTSEVKQGMKLNCDLLKRITDTGATISARRMRENEVSFLADGIVVMLCNVFPHVEDETLFDGDRPVCVPFNHRYEQWERDTTLKKRLSSPQELSGVLNWALEGLARYRTEGLEPMPDAVREMCAAFRANCDPLTTSIREFVNTRMEHSDGEIITISDAYQGYVESTAATSATFDDFKSRIGMFVRVVKRKRDPRTGAYRRNVIPDTRLV